MKKINGIHTLSAHEQLAILAWYNTTKKLLWVIFMMLIAATIIHIYLQKYYLHTCTPCISPTYTEIIAKKHATHSIYIRNQKQKNSEQQQSSVLITNYATIINLHTEPSTTTQLTELQLSPQGITTHYAITNRNAIQICIDRLNASPVIKQASFESIDQKNTTIQSNCVIKATWQK